MVVDVATLRRWSANASTLDERLFGDWETIDSSADGARRLDLWSDIAAKDDVEEFRQILALALPHKNDVLALLGDVNLPESESLPAWAAQLPNLLQTLITADAEHCAIENPVSEPFVDLFLPLVDALRDQLKQVSDPSRWTDSAQCALASGILCRIAPPFSRILFAWFECYREVAGGRPSKANTGDGPVETRVYKDYLSWLRSGHLIRILEKWSVLARYLSVTTAHWEQFALEIVDRLSVDLPNLIGHVLEDRDPGPIIGVETNISDPHNQGRCVAILHFADGQRLVYKPRDLAVDQAWGYLLAWMRSNGAPFDLKSAEVYCGDGYGWTAHVEPKPCQNETEVRTYFQRSGALLGLIHVLGGTDFHHDNVIAAGDHPVAVDLETLLGPNVSGEAETDTHPAVVEMQRQVSRSVLGSGFLPTWDEFRGRSRVVGGLSKNKPNEKTIDAFLFVNTDAMRLGTITLAEPPSPHLPCVSNTPQRPSDYSTEIENGFRDVCCFLLANRDAFIEEALPALRDGVVRVVLQDTEVYSLLMERTLQPPTMKNGLDSSLELELLWRLHHKVIDAVRAQVEAERRALGRFDIPLFRMSANSTVVSEVGGGSFSLAKSGGRVSSPYQHALSRLSALDERHIRRQSDLIRIALESNQERGCASSPWPEVVPQSWNAAVAVRRAETIGDRILRNAIVVEEGASWLSVSTIGLEERLHLTTASHNYYDGTGGIAVFLAALYRITGRKEFCDYCVLAFAPLSRMLNNARRARTAARTMGIGGGVGLGSVIYCLVLSAALTKRPDLLAEARRAADLFTESLISSDTVFDVIGGAAGGVLGLLALHGATDDPSELEKAVACGRHLIQHHRPESKDMPHLTGFSHGAAGFAYALRKLANRCGDRAFSRAAADWLVYERSLFDPISHNWLDLRFQTEATAGLGPFACGWCHGAAGIGLARLASHQIEHDAETEREIENAVSRAIAEPMSVHDNVCCANFGRLDLLLQAGVQLRKPRLIDLARERAACRLAATSNGYQWAIGTDDENLGFFQGLSGIGYELLRLAYPSTIPSALLWQTSATAGQDSFFRSS